MNQAAVILTKHPILAHPVFMTPEFEGLQQRARLDSLPAPLLCDCIARCSFSFNRVFHGQARLR